MSEDRGLRPSPPDSPELPGRWPRRPAWTGAGWARWILVLIPALFVGIEGWSRRWVADDAFIDFRVVSNILGGHGPVYNVGERVEAYTDPLWVLVLCGAKLIWFVPIEWSAVILGIGLTVAGVVLAGRAAQEMATTSGAGPTVPIGMVVVACVDATWDFASSGLETGLIFGWLGLTWWSLVRYAGEKRRSVLVAVLVGLGALIRPDMALISASLLVALVALATQRADRQRSIRRAAGLIGAAVALPLAYQLWRMAYFAMVVPNTALAKSGGSSWWSEGWAYLRDFVGSYWLWIPLLLLAPVFALELRRISRSPERRRMVVLLAPVVGGMFDGLYVVRVGGDYMHARMLLPALFAICMPLYATLRWSIGTVLVAGAAMWGVVAATSLQYRTHLTFYFQERIVNERAFWVQAVGNPHPVTVHDWSGGPQVSAGLNLRRGAQAAPSGSEDVVVYLSHVEGQANPQVVVKARMSERVVDEVGTLGVIGYVAGDRVLVVDAFSLANPVSSHFVLTSRGFPGHEKFMDPVWYLARYVPSGTSTFVIPAGISATQLDDARAALSCGALHDYLDAIARPLTFGLALSNIVHSIGFTQLSYSRNPTVARTELCGH